MAKTIKIGGRLESVETGNIVAGANQIIDDAKNKKQSVINGEVDAELVRLDETKQGNLTFDNAPTEDSNNPVKSGGVYAAEKLLSDAIEAILLLIPSAASALNKLVDMQTMNSSIATATATFRGTYNVVSDLELAYNATHEQIAAKLAEVITTADNNDYAFVQIPVSATSQDIAKTERYKFNGEAWAYEYDLNNSGFTQAQWDAINSTITAALVTKLGALPTATDLLTALNGKQDNLTFDVAPTSGSQNPVTSGGIYSRNAEIVALISALDTAKQDKLTFDSTPTQNSSNPVTSNGVYVAVSALQAAIVALDAAKQNVLTFDSTPTLGSNNPVKSSGIKTELNRIDGDIVTLNNLYQALTQSALVVVAPTDTWPVSNPNTTTIYRVVDRVNTPPQYYSDYMWNGTTMVEMAQYDNAIDDVPTTESANLVKSGGVKMAITDVELKEIKNSPDSLKIFTIDNTVMVAGLLRANGNVRSDAPYDDFRTSDFIDVTGFTHIKFNNIFISNTNWRGLCFYDSNKTHLDYTDGLPTVVVNNGVLDLSNYPNTAFIRFSPSGEGGSYIMLNTSSDFSMIGYDDIKEIINTVSQSVIGTVCATFTAPYADAAWQDNVFQVTGNVFVNFTTEDDSRIDIGIYDATTKKWLIPNHEWKEWEYVDIPVGHYIRVYKQSLESEDKTVSCRIIYGTDIVDIISDIWQLKKDIDGEIAMTFVSTPTNTNLQNGVLDGKGYAFINFASSSPISVGLYDYTDRKYLVYPKQWVGWEFVEFKEGHSIIVNHNTLDDSNAFITCNIVYGSTFINALPSINKDTVTVGIGGDYERLRDGIKYAYDRGNTTVYVLPGEYDILEEWAYEIEQMTPNTYRGNKLGNNMHLIFMAGSYVKCLYELSGDDEKDDWMAFYFQPFTTDRTDFIVEGLNIEASNCRYCVHDECAGGVQPYIHKYINCRMKNTSDRDPSITENVFVQCIGGGLGQKGTIFVDGGHYESVPLSGSIDHAPAISYHTNNNCDSRVCIRDVYFKGVCNIRFGVYGDGTTLSLAEVCGCSLGYAIDVNIQEIAGHNYTSLWDVTQWNNEIRT